LAAITATAHATANNTFVSFEDTLKRNVNKTYILKKKKSITVDTELDSWRGEKLPTINTRQDIERIHNITK
jgi:hypothetical protein